MRIVRRQRMKMEAAETSLQSLVKIDSHFPDGKYLTGSGFAGDRPNEIVTCDHVVFDSGNVATRVLVNGRDASILERYRDIDVAVLSYDTSNPSRFDDTGNPEIGSQVYFAGYPSGVKTASFFQGIISAVGERLITTPSCKVYQINGMINSGNSGGPLVAADGKVLGVITAKYVPLLVEVDKLLKVLKEMPQFPSEVSIGTIDFSKFVNMMMASLKIIAGSLRLVQVGTGYAVPISLLTKRRS